ncbi:MAG: hypothetical protein EPO54_01910 [Brevundimonas sp.]|jgi:hypothetical protein|nr:MAG: hypothetical protein EPO54_01910 [Brevundimonas sp.]
MTERSYRTLQQDGDLFGIVDGSRWILHPHQVTHGPRDQTMYDAVFFGWQKAFSDLQMGRHDCDVICGVCRQCT